MSWHVVGYTGSIAGTANTDLPVVADPVISTFNNHPLLRSQMNLIGAYVIGALLIRARFDSPTMRYYGQPQIRPFDPNATPANNPNVAMYYKWPFVLPAGEEIAIQVSNSGAGPTRTSAFIFLQPQYKPIGKGNVYCLRFTGTQTLVANAWTQVTYTMDQTFPEGLFAMIYSEVQGATALAHRWIFDVQLERPGFPCLNSVGNRTVYDLYEGAFGEMGRFYNISLPRLEVFATAADVAQEGYMYIQPVGPAANPQRPGLTANLGM